MKTQTSWLIEKERPRLSIELDTFDPRPTLAGEYCVTGTVFIYGHAIAKVRKAVICVSTDPRVVENAFGPLEPSSLYVPTSPRWIPDNIELPRVIHPTSYGIRFTTTVYGKPWKAATSAEIAAALKFKRSNSRLNEGEFFNAEGLRVTTVPAFLNSYALFCRAIIEYSAANKPWPEELKMRFWVFGDPNITPEYGFWEDYDEKQQDDEDCPS
jgi:hypothetical protein